MQCSKCHGEDGRGVGPSSNAMVDAKGRHVNARDFTQPGSYRTGWTEREIIRTLETGMNGVPMPSYIGRHVEAGRVRPRGVPDEHRRARLRQSEAAARQEHGRPRRARSGHHAARARVEVRAVGDSHQARRSRAGSTSPRPTTAWAPDTASRSTGSIRACSSTARWSARRSRSRSRSIRPAATTSTARRSAARPNCIPKMHGVLIVD